MAVQERIDYAVDPDACIPYGFPLVPLQEEDILASRPPPAHLHSVPLTSPWGHPPDIESPSPMLCQWQFPNHCRPLQFLFGRSFFTTWWARPLIL